MVLGRRKESVDASLAGSVEAAIRRSLQAAIARDWDTAETWLERIVEADTDDLDAYHALARLYREQGAIGRAIRMHQNLLLRSGLDKTQRRATTLELARDFDAGGFAERAAAGYEEVLAEEPRHAEALTRLVALCDASNEWDRGLALVKRLRRIDRGRADEAECRMLLGQARAMIDAGEADAARTVLKRCLRRGGDRAEAHRLLGDLEAERGRDARAIQSWTRAVEADRALGPALFPKIEAGYAARGKPGDFAKWLERLAADLPEDPAVPLALARTLASRGEQAGATRLLASAVEAWPSSMALRVELGRRLLDAGSDGEALKAYRSLLEALDDSQSGIAGSPSAASSATTATATATATATEVEADPARPPAPGDPT